MENLNIRISIDKYGVHMPILEGINCRNSWIDG